MSDDLAERLEILVHSAAPTSKKEDDRLRAQALACLGFQSAKRTLLTDITFTRKRLRLGEGGSSDAQKSLSSQTRSQTRKSREANSQLQETETKEQHLKVPRTTKLMPRVAKSTSSSPLEVLRRSVESNEDHVIQGLLPQAIGIGVPPIDLAPYKQSPPCSRDLLHRPTPSEDEPPSSYATSRFDSWESPPASIPDSQPLHNVSSPLISPSPEPPTAQPPLEGEKETESSDKSIFLTLSDVSFCYGPPPPASSSIAPLYPHLENSLAPSEYSLSSLNSASYPSSPHLPEFNPSFALRTLIESPYEILSPPPTTSSNPPLITHQLRKITEVGYGKPLLKKYQKLKKSQVRELRQWERGYWSVDTSSWVNVKAKINFWNMLKDNVMNGRLGSVNVFLDSETGNIINIYCFGGMAEHLWCALFVMSSRNTRNATWMDASDNEIIKF